MKAKWLMAVIPAGILSLLFLIFLRVNQKTEAQETIKILYFLSDDLSDQNHTLGYGQVTTPTWNKVVEAESEFKNQITGVYNRLLAPGVNQIFVDNSLTSIQASSKKDQAYSTAIIETNKKLRRYIAALEQLCSDTISFSGAFSNECDVQGKRIRFNIPADTIAIDFSLAKGSLMKLIDCTRSLNSITIGQHSYDDPTASELVFVLAYIQWECFKTEDILRHTLSDAYDAILNRRIARYKDGPILCD